MPKLRLAAILQRLALAAGDRAPEEKKPATFPRLAAAIAEANNIPAGENPPIDGRTLAKIIYDEKNFALNKRHLEALNKYLRSEGYDLSQLPIFEAEGLLQSLVEKQRLTFFLTTRSFPGDQMHRGYNSDWDVKAMGSVMDAISSRWKEVRIGIQQEVMRATPVRVNSNNAMQQEDPPSECVIGSPLVSRRAEAALSSMFFTTPFERPPRGGNHGLPFYFVWHPKEEDKPETTIVSAFALQVDDLTKSQFPKMADDLPQRIKQRQAQAFVMGNDILEVNLNASTRNEYGIVAAQRWPNNEIALVIAGLSGPSTYAVAAQLPAMNLAVPDCAAHERSSTIYAVVEATVEIEADHQGGDNRVVTSSRIIVPPTEWSPAAVQAPAPAPRKAK